MASSTLQILAALQVIERENNKYSPILRGSLKDNQQIAKQKLTQKQALFVKAYLVNFNGTKAAIKAGYSPKGARQIASNTLSKVYVQEALANEVQARCERVKFDSDSVLNRLVAIDQMDVADIFNDDFTIKSLSEWPEVWRQFLSALDVAEIWEGRGSDKVQIGVLKKIKWPCKLKTLELLGRHVNVQAWKEKVEVTNDYRNMSMEELVRQRREMAKKLLEPE